jgi:hypothetical protein
VKKGSSIEEERAEAKIGGKGFVIKRRRKELEMEGEKKRGRVLLREAGLDERERWKGDLRDRRRRMELVEGKGVEGNVDNKGKG